MKPSPGDPSMNVNLNPVTRPDGRVVAWGEAVERLSNEAMSNVRHRRAARDKEE